MSIVFNGCSQSSFRLFYVVIEMLIDASTLLSLEASPFPPSFLDILSLSTSSLGCNALYMFISFLVLKSICLSSSLVHLEKGPEYLTRNTAQVFIPLIRFLQDSFVSSSFLFSWDINFEFCLSFPLVWLCQHPRCPSIWMFSFLRVF